MNKLKINLLILLVCLILAGCATFPASREPVQKSNLTVGVVKKEIVKGKTTQTEILGLFGSPNLVSKNRSGDEVWNYNRMAFEAKTGQDGMSLILFGGSRAMSSSTTRSFDLIIVFDERDVVLKRGDLPDDVIARNQPGKQPVQPAKPGGKLRVYLAHRMLSVVRPGLPFQGRVLQVVLARAAVNRFRIPAREAGGAVVVRP